MASWSNDHLIDFIDLFREQEPLWKIKHKDYYNNVRRARCYEVLLEKMKTIDSTADLNKVKKKINNLRTVFRKELKKHNDSAVSGSSADEVYSPRLSYFNNLMFLKDQEIPLEGMSSTNSSITAELHEDGNENSSHEVQLPSRSQDENADILPPPPTLNSFKRKKVSNSTIDLTLENINKKILSIKPDDNCDIFGKTVASKLKSLPKDQRIWAEKIINETLLEAELGNLNRQTVTRINHILNNTSLNWQPPTSPYSQNPTSPYSQNPTSPHSQRPTSPYSHRPTSPYSQRPTSPYSQRPTSPYSHRPTSPYSQRPTSPYAQRPTSPYSQRPTSPYSQRPTSPYSQRPISPYSQRPTSPYSQPHNSPYSQSQTSLYSQSHTSPYSQPRTSPSSQAQTSPYSQLQIDSQAQKSPYSQPHLSQSVPPTLQEIQTPPQQQIILLNIPENQSSQPQTQPLFQARQISPQEQNLITFLESFQS